MEQSKAREEVNKVLAQQADKGVKRNEICRSLFSFGLSEHRVALLLGIKPQTAHAAKLNIRDGKREKKELKNYLVLDVIRLQGFLKNRSRWWVSLRTENRGSNGGRPILPFQTVQGIALTSP